MSDTFLIFDHFMRTLELFAEWGQQEVAPYPHRGFITGWKAAAMNIVSLGTWDDAFVHRLKTKNIPFFCFPLKNSEEGFKEWGDAQGLVGVDQVVAQEFVDLASWVYPDNKEFHIRRVRDTEDLQAFDEVERVAFDTPPDLHARFFGTGLNRPDVELFIATSNGNVVGAGLSSLINGVGGLYWMGVLPDYRRRGIGAALAHYGMNGLKNKGAHSVYVLTMALSNGYFQEIGFKPKGALELYLG